MATARGSGRKGLLVALGALLVACSYVQQSSAFDSDKVYRYDFEGAITTKVADDSKPQYSGLAISSPIVVKKTAADELTVRLEQPKTATFNEVIDEIHLYKYNYKPIEGASGLDKAFRIYLEDGAVKSFDSHKDEPKWVTNFKRGLLSFFQLKLKSQAGDESASKSSGRQFYTSSEKSVFGECETDYLVMADNQPIEGANEGSGAAAATISVTKTRNMARCKSRFLHRFMPIDSSECYENEKDLQQYKHSNAIFQFELLGTKQNYVIKQVLLDEKSTFSPFGQKAHSHLISSKFMLKLNETASSSAAPTVDESSMARLESLSYDPPEMVNFYANVNLDQEHHLSSIYQSSATVEQVMVAFEALVQEHRLYTSAFEQGASEPTSGGATSSTKQERSRLAELFIKLNELVGTLNIQKIEQLYAQVDERGEAHKKIFWDLMSVTGTNPSFVFMKRLITDGDAPSVKIKDFLTRLSYHIKMPSKSLFDEYVNLCKSDKIQTNLQYKRLCSLPLASLIHQHCAKPHAKYLRMQHEGANATAYKRGQNTCQIATAEEYFTRLVSTFGGASGSSAQASSPAPSSSGGSSSSPSASSDELSIGDKMFNIKMAGELGVRPSVDFLLEIVANRDEHPSLRSAAMWNLNKASSIYPSLIKRQVVPYYYDRGELLELRIAAFYNWIIAGMSLHEMETLAKQLHEEPSRQLVVYIHSLVHSIANLNSFPCANSNDRHARLVLPTIKRALARHSAPSFSDSHASLSNSWLGEFGYGTKGLFSIIYSNESMAPSNIYYASTELMSGQKLTPLSVSIQAHGLDKLVKRVIGVNGLLADKDSFMDVFSLKRRSKRQAAADLVKQEAQEIDKELKLSAREFSDVYVAITISAYGRPVTFFDRDSRELKKMLSDDGTIKIPAIKKLLHSFNNHTTQQMLINFEKLEVFNNELGLPVYQSISDFDYKTFKLNSVKIDVEPGFFRDERQGKPPTRLLAALDSKMGRHNEMFVSTGAIVPNEKLQVGVGFHKKKLVNIPLKINIEANLTENQISIKRWPVHESLLYIKQTPVTFIKSFDPSKVAPPSPSVSLPSSDSWLPLYSFNNSNQMKPFELEYMTPLALGVRLEGLHKAGQDWSMAAWRRHLSSIGMQAAKFMYFYSPTGQPLEARLSVITTGKDKNPTSELVELFSWRHHHQDGYSATGSAVDSSELTKNEVEKELERTTSSESAGGPPSTVSYKLALVGGSAAKERRVGLDIAYSRSFDRLLHKWRVFYSRTPFDQVDPNSEVTNLCWLGQLQFPKHSAEKLLNFDFLGLDNSANLTSELTFGDECGSGSRVDANVTFGWSAEQRAAVEEALVAAEQKPPGVQSDSQRKNPYVQLHKKCLAQRELHGGKLDPVCVQLVRRASELTHISAKFDYKNVPARWTKLARRAAGLYMYARAGYMDEIDDAKAGRDYKSADGQREQSFLEANISLASGAERLISYEFDTSSSHVVYRNVPINVAPLSTFPLLGSSYYQQVQKRAASSSCFISGQVVQTFDNLTYTMPPVGDGCVKLVAKDCSPEANFVIVGSKFGQNKLLKVYVAQKFKVEFIPDKSAKKVNEIKVNGETVSIEQNKPPLRRETKLGARSVEAFTIDYNGAYYTINSKLYKFSMSTDGGFILIQQSKYYAGKSCGLCGDANGDQLLEFKSPTSAKRTCKNAYDMTWAHVLPSTCPSRPANIECA